MREINLKETEQKIIQFMTNYFEEAGVTKGIIGLSGGVDSSLVAYLAAEALGKENLIGVLLPYEKSSRDSLIHGKIIADNLNIKSYKVDISPMVNAYFNNYERDANKLRQGNFMARMRMSVLYDLSAAENALVLGTSNKTELYLGYMTQYGDAACAFEPVGHLYKTEIWQLAKMLGVPPEIINKKPSADLWQDQTDEQELGITYKKADEILYLFLEKQLSRSQIISRGFAEGEIEKVLNLMENSKFKRNMPPSLNKQN